MTVYRAPALFVLFLVAGCSAGTVTSTPHFVDGGASDGSLDASADAGVIDFGITNFDAAPPVGPIVISPANTTINVISGMPVPTQSYTATINDVRIAPSWSIDRGELGTITPGTGLFTPAGTLGGIAHITANFNGMHATTSVTVHLAVTQVGDPNFGMVTSIGASGYGGVGGDGPGGPATTTQQTTLMGAATTPSTIKLLYPYDQTVFPRGILPPLLQWDPNGQLFDAAYLHITEANYEYSGYFTAQNAGQPFVNLPIPQTVWQQLTYSNAGEAVTVSLTFASGASVFGPYAESWKIAPATLQGTVYYNSYGTALATNYQGGVVSPTTGLGDRFGGATLAIKPASTVSTGGTVDPPRLVAGTNSPPHDYSGCRVCHSVSANGGTLMTQHGENYYLPSFYDLTMGNAETTASTTGFSFSALSPDGTMVFTGSGIARTDYDLPAFLASVPTGTTIMTTGLPIGFKATSPAFSPDGTHIAFNFHGGPGADSRSLAVIDFDNGTKTFSNLRVLYTPSSPSDVVFPSFLPTNDGVIFAVETGESSITATNGRSELWWIDLETMTPTRLDKLNGAGYVPVGSAMLHHDNDATLNYEPTVNPISSGGYVWVVFTSRRMYGNVAAIDAYASDPRGYNWTELNTPKKLWVAAIDLNAPAGTDPSHPAFYLPAQEIHGSNARGYWTVDPCHVDGASCATGDECCGGYCQPDGTTGALMCNSTVPVCSQIYDRCNTTSDCCNAAEGVTCISNICTVTLG